MEKQQNFVISVSRQFGSGAATIGQRIAKEMGILYADREIVKEAGKALGFHEHTLSSLDERSNTFWENALRQMALLPFDTYTPPEIYFPSDQDLFEAESQVIRTIADNNSAIIIGRCAGYVLRNAPNHLSIFLTASEEFRIANIQRVHKVSSKEATELLRDVDAARARYAKTFTGYEWMDLRQYHLVLDTSALGLDTAAALILYCANTKFGING